MVDPQLETMENLTLESSLPSKQKNQWVNFKLQRYNWMVSTGQSKKKARPNHSYYSFALWWFRIGKAIDAATICLPSRNTLQCQRRRSQGS
jgi:hypothetical protein